MDLQTDDRAAGALAAGTGWLVAVVGVGVGAAFFPSAFPYWFAGSVLVSAALVFMGVAGALGLLDVVPAPEAEAQTVVDDWQPAFTEAEYAEMRKKVPFIGIFNSGGPGYSDDSERVEEILYGAPPPPPRSGAIIFATQSAAETAAQGVAVGSGSEVVRHRSLRKPARQQ